MQTFVVMTEDVKEVYLVVENLIQVTNKEAPSYNKPSEPEGLHPQTMSLISTSKSGNKKDDVSASVSDGMSFDPVLRTPKKKANSSAQINLDKDSNSKKLENKFRLECGEESQPFMILEGPARRLIVQNFEIIQKICEERKNRDSLKAFDSEVRSGVNTDPNALKGSIASLDSGRDSINNLRFSLNYKGSRIGQPDKAGLCNPCLLI
jgi:hypothetical protein